MRGQAAALSSIFLLRHDPSLPPPDLLPPPPPHSPPLVPFLPQPVQPTAVTTTIAATTTTTINLLCIYPCPARRSSEICDVCQKPLKSVFGKNHAHACSACKLAVHQKCLAGVARTCIAVRMGMTQYVAGTLADWQGIQLPGGGTAITVFRSASLRFPGRPLHHLHALLTAHRTHSGHACNHMHVSSCFCAPINKLRLPVLLTPYACRYEQTICPTAGLHVQNYRCADCKVDIGYESALFAEARQCFYSGRYMCPECHRNDMEVIPACVIFNWDFVRPLHPPAIACGRLVLCSVPCPCVTPLSNHTPPRSTMPLRHPSLTTRFLPTPCDPSLCPGATGGKPAEPGDSQCHVMPTGHQPG